MGPAILARAGLPLRGQDPWLRARVHGQAQPALPALRPRGDGGGAGVLVGSRHTAESLWARRSATRRCRRKTRLGPPGVDTELFAPLEPAEAAEATAPRRGVRAPRAGRLGPRRRAAAAAVEWLAAAAGPRVVFVGKLIVSKGIDLLLAAWPLVHAANPGARLLVVGFGELPRRLQRFWAALARGTSTSPREIAAARAGRSRAGRRRRFGCSQPSSTTPPRRLPGGRTGGRRSVSFAGRLEHDEVGRLLPACDALVFPSTFPESFGMVAAEAASAGVLPVSANHSGHAEVSRELAAALPAGSRDLLSFDARRGGGARRSPNGSTAGWRWTRPPASWPGPALRETVRAPVELGRRRPRRDRRLAGRLDDLPAALVLKSHLSQAPGTGPRPSHRMAAPDGRRRFRRCSPRRSR